MGRGEICQVTSGITWLTMVTPVMSDGNLNQHLYSTNLIFLNIQFSSPGRVSANASAIPAVAAEIRKSPSLFICWEARTHTRPDIAVVRTPGDKREVFGVL